MATKDSILEGEPKAQPAVSAPAKAKQYELVLLATYPVYCLVLSADEHHREDRGGNRWERVQTRRAEKVQFYKHRGTVKITSADEIGELRRKGGYGIDWIIAGELRMWLKNKERKNSANGFIRQMNSRGTLASEGEPIDIIDVTEMLNETKLAADLDAMLQKAIQETAVA